VAEAHELIVGSRLTLDRAAWQLARSGWPIDTEALRAVIVAAAERLLTPVEEDDRGDELVQRAERRFRRGRGGGDAEHLREVRDALLEPGRIPKAMHAARIAPLLKIVEAVQACETPLDALDFLARIPDPRDVIPLVQEFQRSAALAWGSSSKAH
jgi:hypothetical protein